MKRTQILIKGETSFIYGKEFEFSQKNENEEMCTLRKCLALQVNFHV